MKDFTISKRLEAICSRIPEGARLLDVGTDHAYVPIFLLKNGIVTHAWASDINSGPLKSASENAALFVSTESLTLYQSDGLDACCCLDNLYDHIVIAGMGGEMICDIILRSDYIRDYRPKLILQPMTMQPFLRATLCSKGFNILNEDIVFEERKYYSIIECKFSDRVSSLSEFEIAFGKGIKNKVIEKDRLSIDYLKYERSILTNISEGKKRGVIDNTYETKMIRMINELLGGDE